MTIDMTLNYKILDEQYDVFRKFIFEKTGQEFYDFKHPYIEKHENYKYTVKEQAKSELLSRFWDEKDVGSGAFLRKVISAIELKENNLLQWDNRWGDKAKEHLIFIDAIEHKRNLYSFDKLFFDFFKNKIPDKELFAKFTQITTNYRLISYFFFIKHDHMLPLVPSTFDKIFELLGIDFQTANNCDFENYKTYNNIIKQIKQYLQEKLHTSNVNLIDAHSFLWIIGKHIHFHINKDKQSEKKNVKDKKTIADKPKEENSGNDEIKTDEEKEESYLELDDDYFFAKLQSQMDKGHKAESIAFEYEKEKLQSLGYQDLSSGVEIVGKKVGLGYDILSYEIYGDKIIEKQIEVKSVNNSKTKKFFITRNELNKSRELDNYYIYLVETETLQITEIKHPDILGDKIKFDCKTVSYEVKYINS